MYLDAHTHLADRAFDDDRQEVIDRLVEAKIVKVNLIGEERSTALKSLEIKHSNKSLFDVTCGLHPQMIQNYTQEEIDWYTQIAHHPDVICIGEIGLDYYWYPEYKSLQAHHFIRQIELANAVKKPIMIHTRDALEDTYTILKNHRPLYGCIIHSYSGRVEMTRKFLELGCYLSIGGVVTFKNARYVKESVQYAPLERLLTETDAPYLTPSPYRGKRNESSYIPFIVQEIASLKEQSVEIVSKTVLENYRNVMEKAYEK